MRPGMRGGPTGEFILLTGSLGSGKTTLLSDFLALPDCADTGVIVNEAGEINVDGAIVASGRRDLPLALLGNGCICCSLGDDLHAAIDDLRAVRQKQGLGDFRRIVLETSGLAFPGPILRSLMSYDRATFRVRIVSTLDPLRPEGDAATFAIRAAQLTAARRIVVTKTDVASRVGVAAALRVASGINPAAASFAIADRNERARAAFGPASDEQVARASIFSAVATPSHPRIQVFVADWQENADWGDVRDWLEDLAGYCGDRLLRVKGFVSVDGVPDPLLIEGVGTTFAAPRRMPDAPMARGLVIITHNVAMADLTEVSAMSSGRGPAVRPSSRHAA